MTRPSFLKRLLLFFTAACLMAVDSKAQQHDSLRLHNACLHYYSYGAGQPILLLSGGPGIAGQQEDDLAKLLAPRYKAIILDQRGTGRSWTQPMDASTINLRQAVDDIDSLRAHLGLEQLAISGHSWGGMLASAYAARYPHRVKGLLLIGGGELDINLTAVVDENVNKRFQLGDTVISHYWMNPANRQRAPDSATMAERRLGWKKLIYDNRKLDIVVAQAEHGSYNSTMSQLMWNNLRSIKFNIIDSVRHHYKGLAILALGWQDPIAITTLHQYVQAYPQGIIRGIPSCGHMPATEQPERMLKIADEFMRKVNAQ
jgi:proline iminopeptidase